MFPVVTVIRYYYSGAHSDTYNQNKDRNLDMALDDIPDHHDYIAYTWI